MSCNSRCAAPSRLPRRALLAAALAAPFACAAKLLPPEEVVADLPGAHLQGQGRLRWLGLHVYDARLWTTLPLSATDVERTALALELRYARALKGAQIAERSLDEMRRQGEIAPADAERWLAAMTQLFPDVHAGDRITGVHRPGQSTRFHVNGRLAGEVPDAAFARRFFGIWLSPRTSEPKLRAALLGLP
jgi:Chalcone isomerase-like